MSTGRGGAGEGVVVYDDFSRGDWGERSSWGLGKGWFSGDNVIRYADGSVGPRFGLKEIPVTGVPAGEVTNLAVVDDPSSANREDCVFTVGSGVYTFAAVDTLDGVNPAPRAVTAHGAVANLPVPNEIVVVAERHAGRAYLAARQSSTLYRFTASGNVEPVPGAPQAGGAACRYGVRLMVCGPTPNARRVYFSAADDFNSWPAANYFDVGDQAGVVGLFALRDRLVLAKRASLGSQWWVLTGVPGVDAVLRPVSTAPVPARQNSGCVLGSSSVLGVYGHRPLWFDGVEPRPDRAQSAGTADTRRVRVLPGTEHGDAAVFSKPAGSGLRALVRRSEAWTRHTLSEAADTGAVAALAAALPGYSGLYAFHPEVSGVYIVSDGGSAGAPARFYWLRLDNDRPRRPGDAFAGEPPPGRLTLPEHWAADGALLRVRAVVVDYRAFSGLAAGDVAMQVSASCLRQDEGAADSAPAAQQLSEPQPAADANRRRRFTFAGGDFGNGFQVSISGIRGVAVQKVSVLYDAKPMRGAG